MVKYTGTCQYNPSQGHLMELLLPSRQEIEHFSVPEPGQVAIKGLAEVLAAHRDPDSRIRAHDEMLLSQLENEGILYRAIGYAAVRRPTVITGSALSRIARRATIFATLGTADDPTALTANDDHPLGSNAYPELFTSTEAYDANLQYITDSPGRFARLMDALINRNVQRNMPQRGKGLAALVAMATYRAGLTSRTIYNFGSSLAIDIEYMVKNLGFSDTNLYYQAQGADVAKYDDELTAGFNGLLNLRYKLKRIHNIDIIDPYKGPDNIGWILAGYDPTEWSNRILRDRVYDFVLKRQLQHGDGVTQFKQADFIDFLSHPPRRRAGILWFGTSLYMIEPGLRQQVLGMAAEWSPNIIGIQDHITIEDNDEDSRHMLGWPDNWRSIQWPYKTVFQYPGERRVHTLIEWATGACEIGRIGTGEIRGKAGTMNVESILRRLARTADRT